MQSTADAKHRRLLAHRVIMGHSMIVITPGEFNVAPQLAQLAQLEFDLLFLR